MAFLVGHYDPNKTLQIATDWEAIKPLFTGEKANDSGAEACSAPEFGNSRVAKGSIGEGEM